MFSLLPLFFNVFQNAKATVLELLGMLANTGVCFVIASTLTLRLYERKWLAVISVALAAYYVIQIILFLQRKTKDRNLLIIMTGFAGFFITMTFPLLLTASWITAAWAAQAFIFLWMAERLGSNFLRMFAYAIYALALGRLAIFDMGHGFAGDNGASAGHYLECLSSRFASFGVLVISMAASHRLLGKKEAGKKGEPKLVEPVNDIPDVLKLGTAGTLFLCGALIILFVYLHFEAYWFFHSFYPPATMTALTFIWLAALALLTARLSATRSSALVSLGWGIAALLALKIALIDVLSFWHLSFCPGTPSVDALDLFDLGRLFAAGVVYHDAYSVEGAMMRLLDFCPTVAALFFAFMVTRRKADGGAGLFGVLSLALLFLYLTLEVNTLLAWKLPEARAGGVSILWGLFAGAFVLGGIMKKTKELRYAGLALFLIVVLKVFLSDLSRLSQLYRIVAFLILGLLVMAGAVIYVRFKESFETVPTGKTDDEKRISVLPVDNRRWDGWRQHERRETGIFDSKFLIVQQEIPE